MLYSGGRGRRRRKIFYYVLVVPGACAGILYIYLTFLLANFVDFFSELDQPLPTVLAKSQQAATFLETHPALGVTLLIGCALTPGILVLLFVSLPVMLRRRVH